MYIINKLQFYFLFIGMIKYVFLIICVYELFMHPFPHH
jgi:hypothetical protein